ncbi:MAG: PilC/PilY family type IV pilus protein [Pseudomonas sp.]|uniref:pilus assembly protein n=1 Tax=Pseudomonas sp. TaxID=306 RepID=UPI003241CEF2
MHWPISKLATLLLSAVPTAALAFQPISGPVSTRSAAPANVVLLLDNSSSMVLNSTGARTRLAVMQEAASQLLRQHRDLRFGLFAFNPASGTGAQRDTAGGRLLVPVDGIGDDTAGRQHLQRLEQAITSLNPAAGSNPDLYTWTPLAETHYEISRYLRGMTSFYDPAIPRYQSPLQWRCQASAAVVLTDGLPTHDSTFPVSAQQEPAGRNPHLPGNWHLPDWDGDTADDATGASLQDPGSTFYLDDMAAFARALDLRQGGADAAGQSWDDPAYPPQNLRSYTLGFAVDDPRLLAAAQAGGGRYLSVADASGLSAALSQLVGEVGAHSGYVSAATLDGQTLSAGRLRVRLHYHARDWSGELELLALDSRGAEQGVIWRSDSQFVPGGLRGRYQSWRHADALQPAGPVTLRGAGFDALAAVQQQQLQAMAAGLGLHGADAGQQLLDWARGVPVAGLRERARLLGDSVRSAPRLLMAGAPLQTSQEAAYQTYLQQRSAMGDLLLVGANDGLLHVFEAGGLHRYAYLPAALQGNLQHWAAPAYGAGYGHYSGVDGQIALADARLSAGWSTLAAAGLGAGGKGLFAVRLYDQRDAANALGALWEVDAGQPGWQALGHLYAAPQVFNKAGRALLITGNGYGSAMGVASLLVLDAESGELLRQLDLPSRAGTSESNGLSALTLQRDAGANVVAAYAGDLHGQLWGFDLSADDPQHWQVINRSSPLFVAPPGQPLTAAPVLHLGAQAKAPLLLFGSGRLLADGDAQSREQQAFYALRLAPSGRTLSVADLTQRQLQPGDTASTRQVQGAALDWQQQAGWYVPLPVHSVSAERVVEAATVVGSRVLFSTLIPRRSAADLCRHQSSGWLISLALDTGLAPPFASLDGNADLQVTEADIGVIGIELDIGLPSLPQVLRAEADPEVTLPGCESEHYLLQGSEGSALLAGGGRCVFARIHWRQLR